MTEGLPWLHLSDQMYVQILLGWICLVFFLSGTRFFLIGNVLGFFIKINEPCFSLMCFLQPLWDTNPSWLQSFTGQWHKPSTSSSSKWSLFGFGDALGTFDQSASVLLRYLILNLEINVYLLFLGDLRTNQLGFLRYLSQLAYFRMLCFLFFPTLKTKRGNNKYWTACELFRIK